MAEEGSVGMVRGVLRPPRGSGSPPGRAAAERSPADGFASPPPVAGKPPPPPPRQTAAIRASAFPRRTVSGNRSRHCGTRRRFPYRIHVIYAGERGGGGNF